VKRPGQGEEVRILIRSRINQFAIDGDRLSGTSRFHQVVGTVPVVVDEIVDGHGIEQDVFLKETLKEKAPGTLLGPRGMILLATGAGSAGAFLLTQAGGQFEPAPPWCCDEFHCDRFDLFKKVLFNQVGDPPVLEYLVVLF
jgi:hypothetical protein